MSLFAVRCQSCLLNYADYQFAICAFYMFMLCSLLQIARGDQFDSTLCMGQLVYIENSMGKSPIVKKYVNNNIAKRALSFFGENWVKSFFKVCVFYRGQTPSF